MKMPSRTMLPKLSGKARSLLTGELSYNLQRPYPFHRGFKAYVFFGVFLFLGVFTTFNVATTGFDMQLEYTTSPNETEGHK